MDIADRQIDLGFNDFKQHLTQEVWPEVSREEIKCWKRDDSCIIFFLKHIHISMNVLMVDLSVF